MEGAEDRMRGAARLMVRHLAAALALVTTKEPLRNQIQLNIRALALQNGFPEVSPAFFFFRFFRPCEGGTERHLLLNSKPYPRRRSSR